MASVSPICRSRYLELICRPCLGLTLGSKEQPFPHLNSSLSFQGLLQQARGPRPPWTRLLLLLLVFVVGFMCHDFRSHSSFQGK